MKLAVCTVPGSPEDVHVWSGTPAHFIQALRRRDHDPVIVGPLSSPVYRAGKLLSGATDRLGNKINWEAEPAVLAHFTRAMRRQLRGRNVDLVLLMGWYPWGLEPSDPPCVYWGDATVGQRIDLAPHWSNLSDRTRRLAADTEARALSRLAGIFMPSNWAREDAIQRYSLDPDRVFRVPFGANIDDPQLPPRERPGSPLRLLTMGVKWHRKGFDRAVLMMDELIRTGFPAHLDVVGATPPDGSWDRPYVTYHGFLSKQDSQQAEQLRAMYRQADVFLLPTRNDPFPMVLGEAAAYGLPIVAADVGGVPDRVAEGGILLPADAPPSAYAQAVRQVAMPERYGQFSQGSRRDYLTRSSWDASAGLVLDLAETILREQSVAAT
ncbi:glycosyltransferase family 4 protein [Micromonospora sp. NPDC048930]|uniref:glycosyltransferase family 4 protein n=1 Tax=Micromonospora sp. NPDC048930 TaxID=3364261 RepID=UPI0037225774